MPEEIKVKVTIVPDTSGAEEVANALKDLQGMAGTTGDTMGDLGTKVSEVNDQMSQGALGTRDLVESMAALEEPMRSSAEMLPQWSEALGGGQEAIDGVVSSVKELGPPLESSTKLLGQASPAMLQLGEGARTATEQLTPVSDGMVQIQEVLSQSVPLLPQYASSMKVVEGSLASTSGSFDNLTGNIATMYEAMSSSDPFTVIQDHLAATGQPMDEFVKSVGSGNQVVSDWLNSIGPAAQNAASSAGFVPEGFMENMNAFYSALESPSPFVAIQDHLAATGQSWGDFTSSIGVNNEQILNRVAATGNATHQVLSGLNEDVQKAGTMFAQSADMTQAFTDQFNGVVNTSASVAQTAQARDNLVAFQDAMQNPYPFQMIASHLKDTGQSWSDFTSSIGDSNTQMLSDMVANSDVTRQVLGGMSGGAQSTKQAFTEAASATQEFTDQFNGLDKTVAKTSGGISGWIEEGGLGGIGNFFGGVMEGLNQVAMPLMAVQMIGMAVQAVGQGIYDAAAIAEGPAAHGIGTFTGSIDELAQSSQKAGQAFSEAFGQQLVPNIQAANDVASRSISSSGGLGGLLGGMVSFTLTAGELALGGILGGDNALTQMGTGTIANMFGVGDIGQVQTPTQLAQTQAQIATTQAMAQMPVTIIQNAQKTDQQAYTNIADSQSPDYLQSQSLLRASQEILQSTPIPYTSKTDAMIAYKNQQLIAQETQGPTYGQLAGAQWSAGNYGGFFSELGQGYSSMQQSGGGGGLNTLDAGQVIPTFIKNIGSINWGGIGQGFNNMIGGLGQGFNNSSFGQLWSNVQNSMFPSSAGGAGGTFDTSGGCFVAGTRVLMVDGSERAIETLQVGDRVQTKHQPATIQAFISLPLKRVYTLTFSNGETLTLTDSHPISTTQGWKSLSPEHTAKENPDLIVAMIEIGDTIHTNGATCTLTAIHAQPEHEYVYNITVDGSHTYYANGVLVHNKANTLSPSTADASGAITKNVPLTVTWSVQGTLDKITQQTSSWSVQGMLEKASQQVSSWGLEGMLEKASTQVSGWGLEGMLNQMSTQVSGWGLEGDLQKMAMQVSEWSMSGELNKQWDAVSQWALTGTLNNTFQGNAKWAADGLEHEFNAVASWTASNLNPVFNVAASFVGIPGFATGVENFSGGAAVVGENGPEMVMLPSGSSVYPMTTGPGVGSSVSLGNMTGGGGGSAPQSVNLVVQLDSQSLIQAMGIPMASSMRVGLGLRGF